jgi:hypothetical protein
LRWGHCLAHSCQWHRLAACLLAYPKGRTEEVILIRFSWFS